MMLSGAMALMFRRLKILHGFYFVIRIVFRIMDVVLGWAGKAGSLT
jgi:hypothetical protein